MKESGFKKSSFCANDSCCVEVRIKNGKVRLRDVRGKIVEYTKGDKRGILFLRRLKQGKDILCFLIVRVVF